VTSSRPSCTCSTCCSYGHPEGPWKAHQTGVRITFDELTRTEANRAVQELRDLILQNASGDIDASIEKDDADSQDAGTHLVLLFGSSAAIAIAQGVRAYLARRGDDRDGIVIKTADGTEIIATGEAARTLDAPALVRAALRKPRKP
jgi:hypothetical protein